MTFALPGLSMCISSVPQDSVPELSNANSKRVFRLKIHQLISKIISPRGASRRSGGEQRRSPGTKRLSHVLCIPKLALSLMKFTCELNIIQQDSIIAT